MFIVLLQNIANAIYLAEANHANAAILGDFKAS